VGLKHGKHFAAIHASSFPNCSHKKKEAYIVVLEGVIFIILPEICAVVSPLQKLVNFGLLL